MCWPEDSQRQLPDCERLRGWLSTQDAHGASSAPVQEPAQLAERLAAHAAALARARNPLIWIESGDVSAVRAAVRLAELCQATVHVAESPGAHNVATVTSTSGIFGTSLAEVWQHADVIVHVGHQHLREMPLLASRFLKAGGTGQSPTGRRHVFIDDNVDAAGKLASECSAEDAIGSGSWLLDWPRSQWLERFTQLLIAMRGDVAMAHAATGGQEWSDAGLTQLAELLSGSRYAVFIWAEDQFADEADRMLVERLLEVAAKLSEATRCSLLPLGIDPGRTTAKETLLWLSNYSTTACFADGRWRKPHLGENVGLDDWHREHDWILGLRTLPSDRPLPELRFDLVIDAACNQSMHATGHSSDRSAAEVVGVAAVGLDCSGHVTRVDHAFGAYVAELAESPVGRPTAAQVLGELARAYQASGGRAC